MTEDLDIFVDVEPDGRDISSHADTGAWISMKDSEGHLHLPASTELGRSVMQQRLQVEAPTEAYRAAKSLSDLPNQRETTFIRIHTLLGTNL